MPQRNYIHVPQLLSLCSRTHEPQLLIPSAATAKASMTFSRAHALQQEKPVQLEAHALQLES